MSFTTFEIHLTVYGELKVFKDFHSSVTRRSTAFIINIMKSSTQGFMSPMIAEYYTGYIIPRNSENNR